MTQASLKVLELHRTLPFGHCDPAGILYTPRALDLCLEAIDDFWKSVLEGRGWYEMNVHLDRGTPFVNVQLNFRTPLTARTPYVLRVFLVKLGTSSVTFRVCVDQDDRSCFVVDLTSVMVVTSRMEKIDADDWLKRALEERVSEISAAIE